MTVEDQPWSGCFQAKCDEQFECDKKRKETVHVYIENDVDEVRIMR